MKTLVLTLGAAALLLLAPLPASGQQAPQQRLPAHVFDVVPPADWVRGTPGEMSVAPRQCRSFPLEVLRRRIVDVAVQEWAFFGFPVLDRMNGARLLPQSAASGRVASGFENTTARAPSPNAGEAARVAASIGGYWAVTPEGRGIVQQQNASWNGRGGLAARWNAPWSAAFISWVMCEGGLDTNDRFRRAIAHWTYVDQAIRARDGQAPQAAYVAYDLGERTVEPGDLLCSGRRPVYRNLAERRRQMGVGANSHCDIVVEVDVAGERILAIGGNVLRSVSLKVLAGERAPGGGLRARTTSSAPLFAHLKLRAEAIEPNALSTSPVLAAFACTSAPQLPSRAKFVLTELKVAGPWAQDGLRASGVARAEEAPLHLGGSAVGRC